MLGLRERMEENDTAPASGEPDAVENITFFRMDAHMKELISGASIAFVLKVTGTAFAFAFNVLLARLLGAEGAGIYYLALTVTTIASVVGRMGLDSALLRFVSVNAEQNDWATIGGLYKKGMVIATGASALSTSVVFFSASWIAQRVFSEPDLMYPLALMSLGILPLSILTLHVELLRGLKKIRDAMFVQGVGLPLMSIIVLLLLRDTFGVMEAVAAYVMATVTVLLLGIVLWRRATPRLKGLRGHFDTRVLLSASLPLLWVASTALVMNWTDTVMLGIWTNTEAVGVYNAALRMANLTSFALFSVGSIAAPKFARMYAQGDISALNRFAQSTTKLTIYFTAPVLTLFVLAPGWVMGLFGRGFSSGAMVLTVLAAGQFISVTTGPCGTLLMMSGHEKIIRNIVTFCASINVLLNVLLIPRYSMLGAAIATTSSLVLTSTLSAVFVYRKLSVNTLPLLNRFF